MATTAPKPKGKAKGKSTGEKKTVERIEHAFGREARVRSRSRIGGLGGEIVVHSRIVHRGRGIGEPKRAHGPRAASRETRADDRGGAGPRALEPAARDRQQGEKHAMSVNLGARGPHLLAGVDQVFQKKGLGIQLGRHAGFAGIPRNHGHVAQNTHQDAARAMRHGDVHGADNRTDLHDVSPFLCRLRTNGTPVKVSGGKNAARSQLRVHRSNARRHRPPRRDRQVADTPFHALLPFYVFEQSKKNATRPTHSFSDNCGVKTTYEKLTVTDRNP